MEEAAELAQASDTAIVEEAVPASRDKSGRVRAWGLAGVKVARATTDLAVVAAELGTAVGFAAATAAVSGLATAATRGVALASTRLSASSSAVSLDKIAECAAAVVLLSPSPPPLLSPSPPSPPERRCLPQLTPSFKAAHPDAERAGRSARRFLYCHRAHASRGPLRAGCD